MPIERERTDTLLMKLEDGYIDPMEIVRMCLNYMSEEQVTDMMRLNGLLEDEDGEN